MPKFVPALDRGSWGEVLTTTAVALTGEDVRQLLEEPLSCARVRAKLPPEAVANGLASMAPEGPLPTGKRKTEKGLQQQWRTMQNAVAQVSRYWEERERRLARRGHPELAAIVRGGIEQQLEIISQSLRRCQRWSQDYEPHPPDRKTWEEAAVKLFEVWRTAVVLGDGMNSTGISAGGPSIRFILPAMRKLCWANDRTPTEGQVVQFLKRHRAAISSRLTVYEEDRSATKKVGLKKNRDKLSAIVCPDT